MPGMGCLDLWNGERRAEHWYGIWGEDGKVCGTNGSFEGRLVLRWSVRNAVKLADNTFCIPKNETLQNHPHGIEK
jgi:hypothetical protein